MPVMTMEVSGVITGYPDGEDSWVKGSVVGISSHGLNEEEDEREIVKQKTSFVNINKLLQNIKINS